MISRKKIVVTGASGQLGSELQELAGQYPLFEFYFFTREQLSIDNEQQLMRWLSDEQPSFLINCAAYTAVDKAESEPDLAFQVNAVAVGVMARVCRQFNCQFIHISTDYVFDGTGSIPYATDAPTNPAGIYGASKLEGEQLALQEDPSAIIIRTSWVYSSFGKNFVKTMLRLMAEKESIGVVNDQIGSPTYAADLAETILQIIVFLNSNGHQSATGGIYHFSNEGVISWFDFAVAIQQLSASPCIVNPILTAQFPTPAKRPAYSVLDKQKIQDVFGIELRNWKQSLEICLKKLQPTASV